MTNSHHASASPTGQVALLCQLLEAMAHSGPQLSLTPKPNEDIPDDFAALAKNAADSSVLIAESVAALGVSGDDQSHANVIWTESLKQIERIQNLYGWKPLPFQTQAKPGPQAHP